MYNGIGLRTARGSATNGHIQTNLAAPRPPRIERQGGPKDRALPDRAPDLKLLAHEQRRQLEVRCMELRIQLEEEDVPDEEIEKQVAELRTNSTTTSRESPSSYDAKQAKNLRSSDVHRLAVAKDKEMKRFASALGMRDDYRPGEGFEEDYADRQRARRHEEREHRQREKAQRFAERKAQAQAQTEAYEARMKARAEQSQRRLDQQRARDRPLDVKDSLDADLDAMAAERQWAARTSRSPSPVDAPDRIDGKGKRVADGSLSPPPAKRGRARSTSSYDSRSRSRSYSRSPSRSVSPPPRKRYELRSASRSVSPPSRERYDSRDSRSPSRSASPPPPRGRARSARSYSRSASYDSRSPSPQRSLSPAGRTGGNGRGYDSRSPSPPRKRAGRR